MASFGAGGGGGYGSLIGVETFTYSNSSTSSLDQLIFSVPSGQVWVAFINKARIQALWVNPSLGSQTHVRAYVYSTNGGVVRSEERSVSAASPGSTNDNSTTITEVVYVLGSGAQMRRVFDIISPSGTASLNYDITVQKYQKP